MSPCVQSVHQLMLVLIGVIGGADGLENYKKMSYFRDMKDPSSFEFLKTSGQGEWLL